MAKKIKKTTFVKWGNTKSFNPPTFGVLYTQITLTRAKKKK